MSGLKQKAKTSYEISEDSYKTCAKCKSEWASDCGTENCDATKTRWVRLEDVKEWIRVILNDETLCSYYDCCGIKKLKELLEEEKEAKP